MSFYFNVVYFNLLPGTEAFSSEYIRKYDIKTKHCQFQLAKSAEKSNGVLEFNDIVVSTSTMTIEDWKKMNNLGFYVKAIYNYRLAFFVFNYLKDKFNVDLAGFIEYLLKKGETEETDFPIISRTTKILKATQANILKEESCLVKLDSVGFLLYPDFAVFIILIENIESFYAELYRCVLSYVGGKVDREILKEVFLYQYLIIPKLKIKNYHRVKFNYNFNEYFTKNKELVKKEKFCIIGCEDITYSNIEELVQKTIYGNVVFNLLGIKEVTKEEFGEEFNSQDII